MIFRESNEAFVLSRVPRPSSLANPRSNFLNDRNCCPRGNLTLLQSNLSVYEKSVVFVAQPHLRIIETRIT